MTAKPLQNIVSRTQCQRCNFTVEIDGGIQVFRAGRRYPNVHGPTVALDIQGEVFDTRGRTGYGFDGTWEVGEQSDAGDSYGNDRDQPIDLAALSSLHYYVAQQIGQASQRREERAILGEDGKAANDLRSFDAGLIENDNSTNMTREERYHPDDIAFHLVAEREDLAAEDARRSGAYDRFPETGDGHITTEERMEQLEDLIPRSSKKASDNPEITMTIKSAELYDELWERASAGNFGRDVVFHRCC